MNNTDSQLALPAEQCVNATNVEFVQGMLGDRRLGCEAVDLPAALEGCDRIPFLHRHVPDEASADAQLWALGAEDPATLHLYMKDTAWNSISIPDSPVFADQYSWRAVSFRGKLYLAYTSSVDRLHVYDGTSVRRVGLAAPAAAPTAANSGSGSFAGTRYYRVRFAKISGSTRELLSEPSDTLTFAPSGTGSGVLVTRPTLIGESETHWVLEASTDDIDYYELATTATGTTTYTDTEAFSDGYTDYTLSQSIEDYALIPSAKFLLQDDDRLLWAGSRNNELLGSRVGWTPVFGADGSGNDERFETDTDPYKDLDNKRFGTLTGFAGPVLGGIWVFKERAIYKLTRTGLRENSYAADRISDNMGAIDGSVVSAMDGEGNPALYFIDQNQGPCRIGVGGIKRCGEDIRKTWQRMNPEAAQVRARGIYYPKKKQVRWSVALDSSDVPNIGLLLHTDKTRVFDDVGVRYGWAIWTGPAAQAISATLFSDNIDDDTDRSGTNVPFVGVEGSGLLYRCETGNTDSGTAYTATIRTSPFLLKTVLNEHGVASGALVAKATANATLTLKVIKDLGVETTSTVSNLSLAPVSTEEEVVVNIDDLTGAEMTLSQIEFTDGSTTNDQWVLQRLDVTVGPGQRN